MTKVKVALGALLLVGAAVVLPRVNVHAQQASAFANFEGAQTNPIRISADGTRLYAVNTPNQTLSVFDLTSPTNPTLIAEIPVGVEPVSVNPLTDDVVWVVNQVSNSISVVSVSQGIVTSTIQAKPEPMDVVFAGNLAFVSVSRANEILAFNTITHALAATIPVFGDNPRALAVSPDGTKVYAAITLSGNGTTILPQSVAPPQSAPTNPALPAPPQVGLIIQWNNPSWTQDINYTMRDYDVAVISTGAATGNTPQLIGYYSAAGTINFGIAVNPVNGDLWVANTDALNLVNFETNLLNHWVNNRVTRIQVSTGTVTPYDLNPNINYSTIPNPSALASALAQPTGVVVDPGGTFMWVAAFGTDRVAQVSTSGSVMATIEVAQPSGQGSNVDPIHKRGPRGLALDSAAQTLYVLNRLTDTISIINTAGKTNLGEFQVGFNPTPATVQQGRGFLYDAKLSGSGTGSCASCHIDADMDHLAWNLGNPAGSMTSITEGNTVIQFHPMKGPMTTQTLRGLLNLAPYHWRGDHANFQAFNTTFNELMGGSQLSTQNMNLYTSYVNSILFLPNPNENLNRTLPTALNGGNAINGQSDFENVAETGAFGTLKTCNSCHTAVPSGPGSNLAVSPAVPPQVPQPLKNPQLRNIYQKLLRTPGVAMDGFGLNHDGSAGDLNAFFAGGPFSGYTSQQITDMYAYMLSFDTGTAPAVGYTRTLTAANVTSGAAQSDWGTLQSQAAAANIDLVVRGTLNGVVHGLLYQPTAGNYISDSGTLYTQPQLQTLVENGDTLSLMGEYPGTGSATVHKLMQPTAVKSARRASRVLIARK
jgi:DNA-binding beta-propeller fold protein YncE